MYSLGLYTEHSYYALVQCVIESTLYMRVRAHYDVSAYLVLSLLVVERQAHALQVALQRATRQLALGDAVLGSQITIPSTS